MSRHFSIWIVSPPGYTHSRLFEPYALTLQAAFRELNYEAPIVTDSAQVKDWAIVLAANLLPLFPIPLPPRMILYNMEQIQKGSVWLKPAYMDLLRRYPIWDYSERNIRQLKKKFGITGVALCGVGYMPVLTNIAPAEEDLDVVFIGSPNERRLAILNELVGHKKKVMFGYDVYGDERDALIARGKVLLNLHFFEAQVFEIMRVSHLLANRKCVVSETGRDRALEAPLSEGIAFTSYKGLTETCLRFIEDRQAREALAQRGFECFSALSQVPMLKRALAATRL